MTAEVVPIDGRDGKLKDPLRAADALARCARSLCNGFGSGTVSGAQWAACQEALIQYDQARVGAPASEAMKVVLEPGAKAPQRAYPGDAGFDLFVLDKTTIPPRSFVDVDHGIRVELPAGYWGLITGRSGSIRRRGLLVVNGIIDAGYRGPLYAAIQNMTDQWVTLETGERVAQYIPFKIYHEAWGVEVVGDLSDSERGDRGFGSSGQ